jgi:hypothetical protein
MARDPIYCSRAALFTVPRNKPIPYVAQLLCPTAVSAHESAAISETAFGEIAAFTKNCCQCSLRVHQLRRSLRAACWGLTTKPNVASCVPSAPGMQWPAGGPWHRPGGGPGGGRGAGCQHRGGLLWPCVLRGVGAWLLCVCSVGGVGGCAASGVRWQAWLSLI